MVAGLLLSGCTSTPLSGNLPSTIDLSSSYAVQKLEERNRQNPSNDLKDPRAYYHYLMALKAERDYQFEDAAEHYRKVVEHDPKTAGFHELLARQLLRAGKYDAAQDACKEGLKYFPDEPPLNLLLGTLLAARQEYHQALEYFGRVYRKDPTQSEAYLYRGNAYENLGQFATAGEMYLKLIQGEPGNPMGYYFSARAQAHAGKFEDAEASLKEAVSLRPSFMKARELLAWTLETLGKTEEAINEYRVLLKLDPENQRFLGQLGRLVKPENLAPEQLTTQPKTTLEEVLRPVEVHTDIGIIYFQQARYLDALDEFQLAQAREDRPEFHFMLAKIFETLERIDLAIGEYETLKGQHHDSVPILIYLARLYNMNNQTEESVQLLREAIRTEPENDSLYHSLSLAYMNLRKYDLAVSNMRQAVKLNPDRDAYYFELGALLEKAGEYESAIGSMKQAIELNPMHSNAHNFLGYMYAVRGEELDKALDHLKKAISIQPRNGYFLDSLGWIYYKKGEPDKALVEIKKAMIYTSPDPVLYSHLGDIQFSLKNYAEASRAWKTSLSLTLTNKNSPDAETPDPKSLTDKIHKAGKLLLEN